jgi:hypothetical protein
MFRCRLWARCLFTFTKLATSQSRCGVSSLDKASKDEPLRVDPKTGEGRAPHHLWRLRCSRPRRIDWAVSRKLRHTFGLIWTANFRSRDFSRLPSLLHALRCV